MFLSGLGKSQDGITWEPFTVDVAQDGVMSNTFASASGPQSATNLEAVATLPVDKECWVIILAGNQIANGGWSDSTDIVPWDGNGAYVTTTDWITDIGCNTLNSFTSGYSGAVWWRHHKPGDNTRYAVQFPNATYGQSQCALALVQLDTFSNFNNYFDRDWDSASGYGPFTPRFDGFQGISFTSSTLTSAGPWMGIGILFKNTCYLGALIHWNGGTENYFFNNETFDNEAQIIQNGWTFLAGTDHMINMSAPIRYIQTDKQIVGLVAGNFFPSQRLIFSNDKGTTWNAPSTILDGHFIDDIAWNGIDTFMVCCNDSVSPYNSLDHLFVATSADLINWTKQGLGPRPISGEADWGLEAIGYGNGWWMAGGNTLAGDHCLAYSINNGSTWTKLSNAFENQYGGGFVNGITYDNNLWIVCGGGDFQPSPNKNSINMQTSPDGINWTLRPSGLDSGFDSNNEASAFRAMYIPRIKRWYASAWLTKNNGNSNEGLVASDDDGQTWYDINLTPGLFQGNYPAAVVDDGSRLYITRSGFEPKSFYSIDNGNTWIDVNDNNRIVIGWNLIYVRTGGWYLGQIAIG